MSYRMRWSVVHSDFPRISAGMERKAAAVVAKVALDLEGHMKLRAPVDTGTLRNSIQATQLSALRWQVVVGADYGFYVEWGTARMAAQPFVDPAVQAVRPGFVAAMRKVASA